MGKQCICQICSCGKHRCPHNAASQSRVINKANFDNCKVSEYGDGFKQRQPAKRGPFYKQKDLLVTEGEVEYKTIHEDDFVSHPVEQRKIKEPEKYVPPSGKMDIESEYHAHYLGEISQPARIPSYIRTVTQNVPSGTMEQETSNRNDFRMFSAKQRCLPIKRDKSYSPPKSPFNSTSIHRADFQRFNDPPRPSARQPDKISTKGQPILLATSYGDEFKRYSISSKGFMKKKEEYRPPSKPFASNSLMHSDYVLHIKPNKADIHKPIATVFKTDKPMDKQTTNLEDFKSWPVKIREPIKQEEYKKPDGQINLQSTSSDYKNFGAAGVPAKSARPKTKLRTGRDGLFCGTSNYSSDFQFWGSTPVLPVKINDELTRLSGGVSDLNVTSEHKEAYKRHNTAPARIFKPGTSVFQTNDLMSNKTMYSIEFSGRPMPTCPSERLLRDPSRIKFEDDWDTGHRYVIGELESRQKAPLPSIESDKLNSDQTMGILDVNRNTNEILVN